MKTGESGEKTQMMPILLVKGGENDQFTRCELPFCTITRCQCFEFEFQFQLTKYAADYPETVSILQQFWKRLVQGKKRALVKAFVCAQ